MSLEQHAKTKGECAFDMISYLLLLQHGKWSKEKEKEFHDESQEKWVRLADAQNDKKELEGRLQRIRECWTEGPELTTSYREAKAFEQWHNKMVKLLFDEVVQGDGAAETTKGDERLQRIRELLKKQLEFLLQHRRESNMAQSFDWNIGYSRGLGVGIDYLKALKDLAVVGDKK